MDFELISVFPDLIDAVSPFGVTGRALSQSAYRLRSWNPRDYTTDTYRRIDDRPYGGGPGMVMLAEPLLGCLAAVRATRQQEGRPPLPVVHLSPQGAPLVQARVREIAGSDGLILLCGRYEAIDQRFLDAKVDEELSIGDFVVSGGELPALLLIDAVVRLLPGVLNDADSARQDSFSGGLLDCPHYTRPERLVLDRRRAAAAHRDAPDVPDAPDAPDGPDGPDAGQAPIASVVPPVLLSGNHRDIACWRRREALLATARKRPDLLARARAEGQLTGEDLRLLDQTTDGTVEG